MNEELSILAIKKMIRSEIKKAVSGIDEHIFFSLVLDNVERYIVFDISILNIDFSISKNAQITIEICDKSSSDTWIDETINSLIKHLSYRGVKDDDGNFFYFTFDGAIPKLDIDRYGITNSYKKGIVRFNLLLR